jgi:hypothetical protein
MPKENVNDCITDSMRVEFGWGAIAGADDSGYVQVGATNEKVSLVPQVMHDEKGNPIEHDDEPIPGWFVHLDPPVLVAEPSATPGAAADA